MSLLKQINDESAEFKSLNDLETGRTYKANDFKFYGDMIAVNLDDSFRVFLPDRFAKRITKENLNTLNDKPHCLIYLGRKAISRGRTMHCLEIVENC